MTPYERGYAAGLKAEPDWAAKYAKEREYQKAYRLRNKHRAAARRQRADVKEASKVRNKTDPHRLAWYAIRYKVKRGYLKRGDCVYCGKPNAQAHHEDYNRRYEIVWVCADHHAAIHAGRLKVLPEHVVVVGKQKPTVSLLAAAKEE